MRAVSNYELVFHGMETPDYFQGCGVAFTPFDECFTGIGASQKEALEDATEQLATAGFEVLKLLEADIERASTEPVPEEGAWWQYVSIRVKESR